MDCISKCRLDSNRATVVYSIIGKVDNTRLALAWNDNSISETGFLVQKTTDGTTWTDVGTTPAPLDQANTVDPRTLTDPATYNAIAVVKYQVVSQNTVGYGGQYPGITDTSTPATRL